MKTGSEIEEEINSSTKGRADTSQASRSPHGSNWPGSRHANCSALAAAHAAFCLLGLSLGTCQELDFSGRGWRGGVHKSVRNRASLLPLPDTMHSLKCKPWGKALLR